MKIIRNSGQKGFTLIELMVVMVILATLAFVVMPKIMGETDTAKQTKAAITIANLETAIKRKPSGISSEKLEPRPADTSTVICMFFMYSNWSAAM